MQQGRSVRSRFEESMHTVQELRRQQQELWEQQELRRQGHEAFGAYL
jgi:hypothetical protein